MRLNRPLAQEQRRRNLPVRSSLAHERSDANLGGCQPFLSRAPTDATKLAARPLDPGGRAKLLEAAERSADRVAGRALLPRPPADDPEREQRARPAEEIADLLVLLNGLLQKR